MQRPQSIVVGLPLILYIFFGGWEDGEKTPGEREGTESRWFGSLWKKCTKREELCKRHAPDNRCPFVCGQAGSTPFQMSVRSGLCPFPLANNASLCPQPWAGLIAVSQKIGPALGRKMRDVGGHGGTKEPSSSQTSPLPRCRRFETGFVRNFFLFLLK